MKRGLLIGLFGSTLALAHPQIVPMNGRAALEEVFFPQDAVSMRSSMRSSWSDPLPSGFAVQDANVFSSFNSAFPSGWADGALWQGKGLNCIASFGGSYSNGWLSAALYPELSFSQNLEFPLNPKTTNPPYGDAHGNTWDHPERFGDSPVWYAGFGQSAVEINLGLFSGTFGTRNLSWGPSRINPIMLSAQGPGFPHLELAVEPTRTFLGTFESRMLYGYLKASDFRKDKTRSGERLWSGLFLSYSPPFWPSLKLTAARTILSYWDTLRWQDALMPITPGINFGVDKYDQRMSLGFDVVEPSIGFQVYGEWARNDFSPSVTAWLLNLEHSQNWVVGLRKSVDLGDAGKLGFEGEIAVLSLGIENMINENTYFPGGADFFVHWLIKEGYTVFGQDLGAGVGNGNMLSASVFWFNGPFMLGYELKRWVKDYSVLIAQGKPGDEHKINVLFDHSLRCSLDWAAWRLEAEAGFSVDMNRYFERNDVYNLRFALSIAHAF